MRGGGGGLLVSMCKNNQECKNIGLHIGVVLETTEVPEYSPVFSQSQFLLESNFMELSARGEPAFISLYHSNQKMNPTFMSSVSV